MCEQLIKTLQQYEGEMRSNGMQVSARSEEFIQQKNSSDAAFDTPVTSRGSNAAVEKEIAMLRKESKRLEEENKRLRRGGSGGEGDPELYGKIEALEDEKGALLELLKEAQKE